MSSCCRAIEALGCILGMQTTPLGYHPMGEQKLLERITVNPGIFGGKPIIRGHRRAVEHVLGVLAGGDSAETILEGYPWLEPEDIQVCLAYMQWKVISPYLRVRT